jgi:hypothetical protein
MLHESEQSAAYVKKEMFGIGREAIGHVKMALAPD